MMTVILFVVILSILVFVHEFGHFIAARRAGMKVYEFAIGFPPLVIGVYKDPKTGKFVWVNGKKAKRDAIKAGGGASAEEIHEYPATLYSINALPLGGFCKIKGENGESAKDPDSFGAKKYWQKFVVLVAGVVMNFLLAAVLLGVGFMIGLPTDITSGVDDNAIVVEAPSVVVQQIEVDSPASQLDLQLGDKIFSVDDVAVQKTDDMVNYVKANPEKEMAIHFSRAGEIMTVSATPAVVVDGQDPRLGIMLAEAAVIRYPWYIAMWKGFVAASIGLVAIFVSFFTIIKNWIVGTGGAVQVSGPVGIAAIIGQSAKLGIHYLINVTAMISLSLAALNILPIPALDGGRLLFVTIEKVTGKPVPLKYEQLAHTIGFILLLILLLVVTVRDVIGLF